MSLFSKGPKAPDVPDVKPEAGAMFNLGDELSAWGDQQYQYAMGARDEFAQFADTMGGFAMDSANLMWDWAKDARGRYEQYGRGAEEAYFDRAQAAQDPKMVAQREAEARGQAMQDMNSSMEATREGITSELEGYGLQPEIARGGKLARGYELEKAKNAALAGNMAGRQERDSQEARGDRFSAGAMTAGRGIAADAAGYQAGGDAASLNAFNMENVSQNFGMNAAASALPFKGGAAAGYSGSAGIKSGSYANAMAKHQYDNSRSSGLGGVIGMGAGLAATAMTGGLAAPAIPAMTEMGSQAEAADGGEVQGPGGPRDDAGALRVSDGEYVLPADVVRSLGISQLDKFVEKQTGTKPTPRQALPV